MGEAFTSLAGLNETLFHALNALVGRSWAVDGLVALAIDNPVIKAGPIGACFLYAWFSGGPGKEARRVILLLTLLSLLAIAPTTRLMAESMTSPRPFLLAHQSYVLDQGALSETPRWAYRAPVAGETRARVENAARGIVDANDLAAFPSDHAGFFLALALGIALAARRAGLIALGWTIVIVFGSRVAVGLHSPADMLAGSAVGAAMLALVQAAGHRWGRRLWEAGAAWSIRHEALAAALLFLALIEAGNTMSTLKRLAELAGATAARLLGG